MDPAHPNPDLSALVGSRICHDLISPIGAIGNGLELLNMAPRDGGAELGLIADSVGHAAARIGFFRVAFGAAGDQMMGQEEVTLILSDIAVTGRTRYDWSIASAQPRGLVRLAFLAVQCLETALPYGGDITIALSGTAWEVTGRADKMRVSPDLWAALRAPDACPDLSPAHVQFGLLPCLAHEAGRRLSVTQTEGLLQITF